jgi:hypothetical protein
MCHVRRLLVLQNFLRHRNDESSRETVISKLPPPCPGWGEFTENATSQELGDQERKNKRADDFS